MVVVTWSKIPTLQKNIKKKDAKNGIDYQQLDKNDKKITKKHLKIFAILK